MTPQEREIFKNLQKNPGMAYAPDSYNLYALTDGGMIHFSGVNFREMTEEQVNAYIIEKLNEEQL